MSSIQDLVTAIKLDSSCEVPPSQGLPKIDSRFVLPDDVKVFYEQCGGMWLFGNSEYPTTILEPIRFLPANGVCLSELSKEEIENSLGAEHFSWGWHIVAEFGGGDELAAINLGIGNEFGYCYDCFWETYPNKDRLFAKSFSDFLERLFAARGKVNYHELFGVD
jgi:antitoxin YokJ